MGNVPKALIAVANNSKSTPLHWATVNKHLEILKLLLEAPDGPGPILIEQKDLAGMTAIGEAEQEEWQEGAQYLISMMSIGSRHTAKEITEEVMEDPIGSPDTDGTIS